MTKQSYVDWCLNWAKEHPNDKDCISLAHTDYLQTKGHKIRLRLSYSGSHELEILNDSMNYGGSYELTDEVVDIWRRKLNRAYKVRKALDKAFGEGGASE